MYIPESMEVIEQGVNDMMKETDFETFIDGIMAAIVLTVLDILKATNDRDEQAEMLAGALNAATEKILLAKEYDETNH